MNKARCNKAIVLVLLLDHGRPENKIVGYFFIIKGGKRNDSSNDNNGDRNCKLHAVFCFVQI
jgi:hypothetical protein